MLARTMQDRAETRSTGTRGAANVLGERQLRRLHRRGVEGVAGG